MDERLIRAGFLRRLGAFVIDAIVAFVLAVAFFLVWTPLLGRRSVGMRQLGIQVVREAP